MTNQNGSSHLEELEDDERKENKKKPSTKSKNTQEIDTQTPDTLLFTRGPSVTSGSQTEDPLGGAAITTNNHLDIGAHESDQRRLSLSRRRKFSHSLSPRFNQEFLLPVPVRSTKRAAASADHNDDDDELDDGNHVDDVRRPTAEQIFRRKSSLPSRPTDLRLLFAGDRTSRGRRVDGRYIGDANEVSFEQDTAEIVESFMVSSYERDLRQSLFNVEVAQDLPSPGSVRETPDIPEFQQITNPLSPTTIVGRRLALIADELETRHGNDLDRMVMQILPQFILASGSDGPLMDAFTLFKNVASRIFDRGQITWSRIVTLLSFGYRMGVALYRQGICGFVSLVVRLITQYIVLEPIHRWIVQSGGWLAALTFRLSNDADAQSQLCISVVWGLTAITVTAVILRHFFSGNGT